MKDVKGIQQIMLTWSPVCYCEPLSFLQSSLKSWRCVAFATQDPETRYSRALKPEAGTYRWRDWFSNPTFGSYKQVQKTKSPSDESEQQCWARVWSLFSVTIINSKSSMCIHFTFSFDVHDFLLFSSITSPMVNQHHDPTLGFDTWLETT